MMSLKKRILAALLCLAVLLPAAAMSGCTHISADNLSEGIMPGEITGKKTDRTFEESSADFALKLFRATARGEENALVSPLSVMLALAMTTNGAKGETKAQMEALLGGGMDIEDLNGYLYTYMKSLPSSEKAKLALANSVWFRDTESLDVRAAFLQKNADYYSADVYKAPFDKKTCDDINRWIEENTDGMIKKMLDSIDDDAVMYLINTVLFDAEWQNVYSSEDKIRDGLFTTADGKRRNVTMMHSDETNFIDDGKATGFIKPYKDGYSFAAFLPNEGVSLDSYLDSMTGAGFLAAVKGAKKETVIAAMPKFEYGYKTTMNDILKSLGMTVPFDKEKADFSDLAVSSYGNIYIGQVIHQTYISVGEKGTRAGAATIVEMDGEAAPSEVDYHTVTLDRPFVYAIIDNATGLPIFIGTVTDIG